MTFPFSNRTDWELSSNRFNDELERLLRDKIDVIDLTESNPTRAQLQYPEGLLNALSAPDNLIYRPDSKGLLKCRQELSRHVTSGLIDPESMVLTSSTSEAYAFLLRLLVNPGERVLIGRPSYPLFQYLIELNDAQYDFYPLVFDGAWQIDFDALEQAVYPNTRVLILVNPNNPTGSYISRAELKRLNEFCRRHQLAIISDEVFFDYRLENSTHGVSLLNNQDVLTFVLGGLSKSLGLPQMKLSWIMTSGPASQVAEAVNRLEIIADTFLSVNTPVQNALESWLALQKNIQSVIGARIAENYETLRRMTQGMSVECLPSQGGWYAVLRIPSIADEEKWTLNLLTQKHVAVHPGYFFDFSVEGHIVVSLLPPSQRMSRGVSKILECL